MTRILIIILLLACFSANAQSSETIIKTSYKEFFPVNARTLYLGATEFKWWTDDVDPIIVKQHCDLTEVEFEFKMSNRYYPTNENITVYLLVNNIKYLIGTVNHENQKILYSHKIQLVSMDLLKFMVICPTRIAMPADCKISHEIHLNNSY